MEIGRRAGRLAAAFGAALGALLVAAAPAHAAQSLSLTPPGLHLVFPDGWVRQELPTSVGAVQWALIDPAGNGASCVIAYIEAPAGDVWSAAEALRMRDAVEPWERFAADYEMMLKGQYGGVQFGDARLARLDGWPVVSIDYVIDPGSPALGEHLMLVGFGTRFADGSLMLNCGAPKSGARRYRPRFDAIIGSVTFSATSSE